MDLDYGVYLPVDVWQENGPPEEMAKAYFDLVESLLQILCAQEGWTLVTGDDAKDTCIRIDVATWAHIDIPLYAAPADDFEKVVEKTAILKAEARAMNALNFSIALDSAESLYAKAQTWDDLDQIMMASRTGKWIASDPESVAKWFRDQIMRFGELGEQFLRVCRYVKAWRDFNWKTEGPTSVSLMIAIAQGFEGKKGRDDIALEHAATVVAHAVRGDIYEHGIDDGAEDFNRLNKDKRIEAGLVADRLVSNLRSSRSSASHQGLSILQALRTVLEDRIPFSPELIQGETPANIVRSTAPAIVAAPYVPNTSAG
ncbi:Cyclic AMP-GMP synthase [compost metagenome]